MKFPQTLNRSTFLKLSQWMAYLCAFGMPWSNAFFNWGLYLMLIFYFISFDFLKEWRRLAQSSLAILSLVLFSFITFKTVFSEAAFNYAWFDFKHYVKLLGIIPLVLIFKNLKECRYLFISLLAGVSVLMMPTLLDGFGINKFIKLSDYIRASAAYGPGDLTYWRMHIQHGFHVVLLFSSLMLAALYYPKYRIWFLLGALMCMLDILFFIDARMALLSLIIVSVFILYFYMKSIKFFLALILLPSLVLGSIFMSAHSIDERLSSIYTETQLYFVKQNKDTSGGNRLHFWKKSLEQFLKAPIFGNGSGSFKDDMIKHRDPILTPDSSYSHAHNEYITQLSHYGLFGALLFLSMILLALKQSIQIKDPWFSKTMFLSTLIFALNAITDSSLHNPWEGWTFVLILALISIASKIKDVDKTSLR
jgi:O-antigen ligase